MVGNFKYEEDPGAEEVQRVTEEVPGRGANRLGFCVSHRIASQPLLSDVIVNIGNDEAT